jgi:hypothetical protein
MAVTGRVGRLTALALATGTIVAASTGVAGASAAENRQMTATGDGSALKITLNLPEAAAALLGTSTIVQTISLTDGKISTVGLPAAETTAVLGKGNIPQVSDLLSSFTKASLGTKLEDTKAGLVDYNANGIKLQVLPLTSKVADPSKLATGTLASSSSAIAHIGISAPLAAANAVTAPVTAVLDTALNTANSTTSQATGAVTSTLTNAISTLNGATEAAGAPLPSDVQAAVDTAVGTLTNTLNGLTTTLSGLSSATELLSLDSITSDQAITRNGAALTSTVNNTVKNINVLSGLVKVEAVTSEAVATAGGVPGSAKATTNAPVFKVDIANGALTALLDQNGLNVGGTVGSVLPADLQNTVNGALGTVNGLLNEVAGVDVAMGKGVTQTAPDGTSAAAAVASTVLTVDPPALHGIVAGVQTPVSLLPAGKKFLTLELVSANAAVANRVVAENAVAPTVLPKALPRTGGSLPLAALATVLLGAAFIARRRRTVEV